MYNLNSMMRGAMMKFYEVIAKKAYEQNVGDRFSEPSRLSWHEFSRWSILLEGCHSLSATELEELHRFPIVQFKTYELSDIYETFTHIHLYSTRLRQMVELQGLAANMMFIPVQLAQEMFFAVRYSGSQCLPCLKPYPVYRLTIPSWVIGYNIYKRRGSLLILDGKLVRDHCLFRVANVEDRPLVVREDILEQWLEQGIVLDFQEVILE
jgi:hypothetical protein